MDRAAFSFVKTDLEDKIVLLTGPRQCGKTTLSRMLFADAVYFNHDEASHRLELLQKSWPRDAPLVIFDELHKMRNWKRWLKGIYDTEGVRPRLLVTGSARLDTHRKVGDSLAGRFFQHRLHPLDMKEVAANAPIKLDDAFERLLRLGGFPEPFLKNSESFANRWRKSHLDIILRQDLPDLEGVRDIQAIETLVELLKGRVGSTISYSNLAEDLQRDAKTIKRWLAILENMYVVFKITPYHGNVARSLLKEPKYYFYDTGHVQGDDGARLENLVACALLKEAHRQEDTAGETIKLHYLRTKDGREVDFLWVKNRVAHTMLETKWADDHPHPHFAHFKKFFPAAAMLQVVRTLKRRKDYPSGPRIVSAEHWLATLDDL